MSNFMLIMSSFRDLKYNLELIFDKNSWVGIINRHNKYVSIINRQMGYGAFINSFMALFRSVAFLWKCGVLCVKLFNPVPYFTGSDEIYKHLSSIRKNFLRVLDHGAGCLVNLLMTSLKSSLALPSLVIGLPIQMIRTWFFTSKTDHINHYQAQIDKSIKRLERHEWWQRLKDIYDDEYRPPDQLYNAEISHFDDLRISHYIDQINCYIHAFNQEMKNENRELTNLKPEWINNTQDKLNEINTVYHFAIQNSYLRNNDNQSKTRNNISPDDKLSIIRYINNNRERNYPGQTSTYYHNGIPIRHSIWGGSQDDDIPVSDYEESNTFS